MSGPLNFKDLGLAPNPYENQVTFFFKVYEEGKTDLVLYDLLGRKQVQVVEGYYPVGMYTETKDVSMLAPGMYMAILRTEERVTVRKAIKKY
jgi:hypothetical protein